MKVKERDGRRKGRLSCRFSLGHRAKRSMTVTGGFGGALSKDILKLTVGISLEADQVSASALFL